MYSETPGLLNAIRAAGIPKHEAVLCVYHLYQPPLFIPIFNLMRILDSTDDLIYSMISIKLMATLDFNFRQSRQHFCLDYSSEFFLCSRANHN